MMAMMETVLLLIAGLVLYGIGVVLTIAGKEAFELGWYSDRCWMPLLVGVPFWFAGGLIVAYAIGIP